MPYLSWYGCRTLFLSTGVSILEIDYSAEINQFAIFSNKLLLFVVCLLSLIGRSRILLIC